MRTFRLVGVALLTITALTWTGFGGLVTIQPPVSVASAADEAGGANPVERGAQSQEGPVNPVLPVLALLMIVMLAARLGGSLMERIGQPGVLGELVFGVILGNLTLIGFSGWQNLMQLSIHFPPLGTLLPPEGIAAERIIQILGEIGVILLLFEVGLESNVKEMMSVGLSSFLVALLGVIAPFLLGWGVSSYFLPDASMWVHVFIGATLCATSVGITARVLKDLGRLHLRESKIILGAAVIDDVLGLVILAMVMGLIQAANTGSAMSALSAAWIIGKAILFLVLAVVIGQWGAPRLFRLASKLSGRHILLTTSLLVLFLFSYIANRIGLATIVGAFAAGLILDPLYYKDFEESGEGSMQELLQPLAGFFVPIFFVRMGYMVDLGSFAETGILAFAGALTLAAILGKQVCSLGLAERGLDRLSVGIGMVPRGEVGLIFAGIGMTLFLKGQKVIDQNTYSAVLIMVIVTTLITPPALKWSLHRARGYEGASDNEMARIAAARREKRKEYFRGRTRTDQRGEPRPDSRSDRRSEGRSEARTQRRSDPRSEPRPEPRSEERPEGRSERRSDRRLGRQRDGGRGRRPQQGVTEPEAAPRPESREPQETRESSPADAERARNRRRRSRPRRRGPGSGGSGSPSGGSSGNPSGSPSGGGSSSDSNQRSNSQGGRRGGRGGRGRGSGGGDRNPSASDSKSPSYSDST